MAVSPTAAPASACMTLWKPAWSRSTAAPSPLAVASRAHSSFATRVACAVGETVILMAPHLYPY